MSLCVSPKTLRLLVLMVTLVSSEIASGQIATGTLMGKLRDPERQPVQAAVVISSELGFRGSIETDEQGAFLFSLPYGRYNLIVHTRDVTSPAVSVEVEPLQTNNISLIIDISGNIRIESEPVENAGVWAATPQSHPEAFSFSGSIVAREPATAAKPLNFTGLGDNRLAWQSQRGFSWTGTQFKINGNGCHGLFSAGPAGRSAQCELARRDC